jgi:hypothetical protein
MESISDFDDMVSDMDYSSTRLDEETKKNIYATKYGIFDLKAKEYLIHADGEILSQTHQTVFLIFE